MFGDHQNYQISLFTDPIQIANLVIQSSMSISLLFIQDVLLYLTIILNYYQV